MDQQLFDELMAAPNPASPSPAQGSPVAGRSGDLVPETQGGPALSAIEPGTAPGPQGTSSYEQSLGDVSGLDQSGRVGGALVAGAAESLFQTKDFLFGQTPEAQKSETRRGLEALNKNLKKESVGYGLVSTLSQFGVGLLGAGKLVQAASAVPRVKSAVEGFRLTTEVGKAAAVGAVAFDPNGERLSNLINDHLPFLANPVTRYLAAQPGDTRAEGRIKNALESIGLDVAVIGVFTATMRGYRALKGAESGRGSPEELGEALRGLEEPAAVPKVQEPEAPRVEEPSGPTPSADPQAPLDIRAVDNPTQGATEMGTELPRPYKPTLVPDEAVAGIVSSAKQDAEALAKHGSWDAAVDAGHVFGRGERIPWQKLAGTTDGLPSSELDAFVQRFADEISKAPQVVTDVRQNALLQQRAALFGEDPAALQGMLLQAGKEAKALVANMEASFLVANKALQDAHAMSSRISAGVLDEFGGSPAAAEEALKSMLQVAADAFGSGREMRAAMGRGMRRMRGEFQLTAQDLANLQSLDGARLAEAMANTGGNPKAIKLLAQPKVWERVQDAGQWLLINNLLSGWRTHVVNAVGNAYMMVARPAERILGSYHVGGDAGAAIRLEAAKQYGYMATSTRDALTAAMDAWRFADSILAPHSLETMSGAANKAGVGQDIARAAFKPWDSVENVLYNAGLGALKTVGAPTRFLGTMDELVQQVVYRSKVQARAEVEGLQAGLTGQDLKDHVLKSLHDAFDDAGRAIDAVALQESKTTTFQQNLNPGTLGAGVQNLTSNVPGVKFILPFVKTPTNVIRMGVKMTPGLNFAQKEYRAMVSGAMGPEAQAQAIGQMAMGSLLLGSAGLLAANGAITGGGPTDRKQKDAVQATGWRPYSFAFPDGKGGATYWNYGRFDPVAMPLGIIADVFEIMRREDDPDTSEAAMAAGSAVFLGLVKSITQKTYLRSLKEVIDGLAESDRNLARVTGGMAGNMVPGSAAFRALPGGMGGDPYMRDARGFVDKIMAATPGLSSKLPAKRDTWGDPITVTKGLSEKGGHTLVDREIERMVLQENVDPPGPPSPNVQGGVDLRDITMKDGRNAYEVYQEYARQPGPNAKPIKDVVAGLMAGKAYQRAPDGPADVRGTKLWIATQPMVKYRAAALQKLRADENVRNAMMERQKDVAASYSAQSPNPTPANKQKWGLEELGRRLGVDLGGIAGR